MFVGDAELNPGSVSFTAIFRTQRLLPCAYPEAQRPLSDRVIELRDGQGMTFKAIAEVLAREAALGADAVFSVYKKRKAHDSRRSAAIRFWIRKIVVYPREG